MLFYHFGYGQYGPARTGKRLRPQLVMLSALHEGADLDDALDAAVAVELLHNYSLVHDDIEDRDELRRGRRTLWNVYGVAQAINAGDALCALTFLTLLKASDRHNSESIVSMTRMLQEAHATMCDGQSLDLHFETAAHVDLGHYYRMIAAKTAALFEVSCTLGAECAHSTNETIRTYAGVGRAYGIAFQIRDDLLGIWATADATGKIAKNDLARRKWTFPIVWALSQAPSTARNEVAQAYGSGGALDADSVSRVMDALDTLGAREAAARAVEEQVAVVEAAPALELREYMLNTLAESVG